MDHLTYSSDQLKSFRSTDLRIPRSLRKILLKSQIWVPRGVSLHSSASSSPAIPTESTIAFSTSSLQNQSSDEHSESTESSPDSPSTQLSGLHIATWNAHSITDKFANVAQTILENKLDILAITETRHWSSDNVPLLCTAPANYSIINRPREHTSNEQWTRGGGTAAYYCSCLHPSIIRLDMEITTFKALCLTFPSSHGSTTILSVYCHGSSPITSQFFEEFSSVLESIVTCHYRRFQHSPRKHY